ncbi:MAG: Rne/Rng family ribonuclease [Acidobacteriota bacterium]
MAKEMIISSSAHEKKVAIVEDGIVTEYYVERSDESQGMAGSIYKGRVMKVLPGMQSAFVNIGLERDAFLYVSDFFEEEGIEEFEPIGELKDVSETRPEAREARENREVREPREDRREPLRAVEERHQPTSPPVELASTPAELPLEEGEETAELGEIAEEEEEKESAEFSEFEDEEDYSIVPLAAEEQTEKEAQKQPEEQASYSHPQVIIPPPSNDFIRIQDEPEPVEAIVESAPVESAPIQPDEYTPVEAILESNPVAENEVVTALEEETEPVNKRRRSRKEPKKKAASRRRGKKGAAEEPVVEAIVAEPQFERIVDDEIAEAGELLKDAILQKKIVDEIRRSEFEMPPIIPIAEPEVRVGSLQAQWQPDTNLQRVVDEEAVLQQELPLSTTAQAHNEFSAELPTEQAAEEQKEASAETIQAHTETTREDTSAENGLSEEQSLSSDLATDGGEPDGSGKQPPEGSAKVHVHNRRGNFASRRGGRRRGRRGGSSASSPRPIPPVPSEDSPAPEKAEPMPKEPTNGDRRHYPPGITDLLREGQEIVVQIAKEPIALKGARITSHIALPGRYLVYMPTVNHIGVSRKIPSDSERLRLKKIMLSLREREKPPGGFIVRTACEGHTEQELYDDMMYLVRTWQDIRRKAERTKAPTLVYRELDLVQRILRDQISDDIIAIRVDNELEYARVVDFVNRFQPKLVKRVKLYTWKKPIFEEYGVQEEIDRAIKPRVWLRSGGYIVINQTEALVAIDVNTGKFVGRSNRLEDTITKTNLEAVKEIVRQIRLRDLGGIIVLDFIDMEERKNRQRVMQALEAELKADRSPSKILQFNDFGLVAITRKRVRQSLERTLCTPCPYCQGAGLVKSPQTICYEILAEARRISADSELNPGSEVILRVNPEIAEALRGPERRVFGEIEAYFGCTVMLKGDESVHQERYDFVIL